MQYFIFTIFKLCFFIDNVYLYLELIFKVLLQLYSFLMELNAIEIIIYAIFNASLNNPLINN